MGNGLAAWAGGSGLNVVVVVNQNSTNSLQLANDYCEKRGVPPQNVFRISGWTNGVTAWARSDFEDYLRNPLLAMLGSSGLTNQIDYVLLSMDIPYRVQEGDSATSTTSALFYGFKTNTTPPPQTPVSCSLPDYSSNSFAFSEMPFDQAKPNTADTNGFLTFMLTDDSLAGAEMVLARGLAADSSFPTQAVYLEKTSDAARNVRFFSFDNAVFDSRVHGDASLVRIASDSTSFSGIRGLQTGFATLSLAGGTFQPGGFGDSLTSYAGAIFDNLGQTPLLAFLNAGAVGSYGTVVEPCNYLQKFPDPLVYVYQRRGFNLAEAYYQSLLNPFEGLLVGEPLCAPFALPGLADWHGLTNGTVLRGQISLPTALFSSSAPNLPLGQVDLFIEGTFIRTLTNLPPLAGNVLSVIVNGSTIQYTVPDNATIASVAAGLANALNAESNTTHVVTVSTGDRLELQSLDLSTPGAKVLLSASTSTGAAPALTTVLTPAQTNFLDTIAVGAVGLEVTNPPVPGDWLQLAVTRTNGAQISISVTNSTYTNITDLALLLMNTINGTPELHGADGVVAPDIYQENNLAQFFVYARSAGWPAAQIQATLTASSDLIVVTPGTRTLEDNVSDLHPRNHLYAGAGVSQLPVTLQLDTTQFADGYHELALVAYEGTSVRTQTRVSRTVQIQNTSLSASLMPHVVGTNLTIDTPLVFSVSANTNDIAQIQLFSTGGVIGLVTNQQTANFQVPTGLLGVGLHPFYAVVTDASGSRFRTRTVAIRVIPSFSLSISSQPLALSWTSIPGLSYEILSSSSLAGPFVQAGALLASGTNAQWAVPTLQNQAFFRVRLSP